MSQNNNKAKKIAHFAVDSFKKTMSVNRGGIDMAKKIKDRGFDLYANIRDFLYIIGVGVVVIFSFFINGFKIVKSMPHSFSRAAHNNFRLGADQLKKNNIIE